MTEMTVQQDPKNTQQENLLTGLRQVHFRQICSEELNKGSMIPAFPFLDGYS